MTDEQYNLRWNNHQPNFISVFQSLFESEELVDVTLAAEGKHIKAHKLILSACSPYFKTLFKDATCKHPIVILDDMKYRDLKTIVDFMYLGEINVRDEQLADILEVAETLQVLGLFDPNKATSKSSYHKKKKRLKGLESENSQSSPQPQSLAGPEESRTTDSPMDVLVDPSDLLEISDQSFKSDSINQIQFNNTVSEFGGPFNSGYCDNLNYQSPYGRPEPNVSAFYKNTGASPTVVRRRNTKVQDSENFSLALEAVRSGSLGFCKAARIYGLNNRTLWLEYKKRGYPSIRPPVNAKHRNSLPSTTS